MTMSSAVSKVTLNGDGVQTSWPFSFKVWKAADLEVSITNAAGVTTVVSNWSVSLAGTGGTVTYPTSGPALPSGHKITIARSMDFLQDVDLVSGTRWDPEVVETALDQATAERQQLKEKLDRAVVVDVAGDLTPEALRDAIFEARDTAVDNAASALNSAERAEIAATTVAYYNHEGTLAAGETTITLPWAYDTEVGVEVYLSGIKQTASSLTFTDPYTVTLNTPVSADTPFEVTASSGARSDLANLLASSAGSALVGFLQDGTGATARTVQDKLREVVSVSDYSSAAAAVDNITTSGLIHVPNGGATTPISGAGKNILWEYDQGGDSRNVIDLNGTRGGFFADYDCKAGKVLVYQVRENQSSIPGGGFRELMFLNVVDNDTANYTTVGQKITYGLRSYVQGSYVSGNYQPQYKDLHGGEFYAIGNIQWNDRGCSGITTAAIQYGSGIASNEFAVQNPPPGPAGGVKQSVSMAAVQPIIRAQFADEDATHKVRGVLVTNVGRRATAGVELVSSTAEGYSGHYKRAIEMSSAVVTDAAIVMPQSASGNVGTVIVYDPNDYSAFDRENNRFTWVVGGVQNLTVGEQGVGIGLAIAQTARTRLQINSSTSALSHLQLVAGSTPSAPNNGEIWFDGSALRIVIGGVVRTVTVT